MPSYRIYILPISIAVLHGILSVLGFSKGYEYFFWIGAMLTGIILLGAKRPKKLLFSSILMGAYIAAGTGIPQGVFIETYFQNNPKYIELAEQLPIVPQAYTLLMIPVFGIVIGLAIAGISWMVYKIRGQ